MNHDEAPVLGALAEHRASGRYGYTPPGHRQGRGADPRVVEVLGDAMANDVLATSGLDDRSSSNGYLKKAQNLMADAVGAEHAFFSTCGSSLSVKASILAVTRGEGEILMGRDAHKSVISGLVLSGLQPRWITPRYDEKLHLAHPPGPEQVEDALNRHPDASAVFVTSPTPYGTCGDLKAIVDLAHGRGKPVIVDEAWGAHLPFHPDLPTWAHGCRRRHLRRQRAQDGYGLRAGVGVPPAGRPRRPGAAPAVRRRAREHELERAAVRGDRRLAQADGAARAGTVGCRAAADRADA